MQLWDSFVNKEFDVAPTFRLAPADLKVGATGD
jgi:hypothetical protein